MYLPILFKEKFSCLIVGGGQVATRKVDTLLQVSSEITIIAPRITAAIDRNARAASIRWYQREYAPGDCRGFQLVIAATPFREINRAVSDEARDLGIPVNVVDDPALSTFIFPAVWRSQSLLVAVSTEGVAPFLAAEIRNRLADYAQGMGFWVKTAGNFREIVRKEIADPGEREKLYRRFVEAGPLPEDERPPASGRLCDWLQWIENIKR
jgi:siroheme synthase-like protein